MRLPPHTPRQFRQGLARQRSLRRRIARGWIIVGALIVGFIGAMAVAHFVYGVPFQDGKTGELSTPANTLTALLSIGGGGALFLIMGILLYRWNPD